MVPIVHSGKDPHFRAMDLGWIITTLIALGAVGFFIGWQIKHRSERRNATPPEHSNAYRSGGPDHAARIRNGGLEGESYRGMSRDTSIGGGEQ